MIFAHIIICAISRAYAAGANDVLAEHGLKLNDPSYFTVSANVTRKGEVKSQQAITLKGRGHEIVQLTVIGPIDKSAADGWAHSDKEAIVRSYLPTQTPYPGDISQVTTGCAKESHPVELKFDFAGRRISGVSGGATSRQSFGACTKGETSARGVFFSYFDESTKRLYMWRVFLPPAKAFSSFTGQFR